MDEFCNNYLKTLFLYPHDKNGHVFPFKISYFLCLMILMRILWLP